MNFSAKKMFFIDLLITIIGVLFDQFTKHLAVLCLKDQAPGFADSRRFGASLSGKPGCRIRHFTKSENLFCTDDEPDSARLHLCTLAHACRTEIYHAPYPRGDFDGRSARQLLRPYPSGLCRGFYLYQPDRLPDLQRS